MLDVSLLDRVTGIVNVTKNTNRVILHIEYLKLVEMHLGSLPRPNTCEKEEENGRQ